MQVRLIIPETFKDETGNRHTTDPSEYLRTIASIAGGYTSYRGYGGWIDSKGLLVEEPITIVDMSINTFYHDAVLVDLELRSLARTIAQELRQESVFLSIDGKAEFIRP